MNKVFEVIRLFVFFNVSFHIFNIKSFWCKRTHGESGDQSSLLFIDCKGFGTNSCLKGNLADLKFMVSTQYQFFCW